MHAETLNNLIVTLGLPLLAIIVLAGIRFAWYILTGRYWLDKRTGIYNRG